MPKLDQTVLSEANLSKFSNKADRAQAISYAERGWVGKKEKQTTKTGLTAIGAGLGLGFGTLMHIGAIPLALLGASGGFLVHVAINEWKINKAFNGFRIPNIKVTRRRKANAKENEVLTFENIVVIDQAKRDEIKSAQEFCKKHPQLRYKIPTFEKDKKYSVKLTLKKPDMTLAELEYLNWTKHPELFDLEITNGQSSIYGKVTDPSEQQKVLKTLLGVSKLIGNQWSNPTEKVSNTIAEGSQIMINPEQGFSNQPEDPYFWEKLANLAIKTNNYDIFEGHESRLKESTLTNHFIKNTKTEYKTLETASLYKDSKPLWLPKGKIGSILTTGLIGLGQLVVGFLVLYPPTAAIILPAISLGLIVTSAIASPLLSIGSFIACFSVLFAGITYFKNRHIKNADEGIKKLEAETKTAKDIMEKRIKGITEVAKNIRQFIEQVKKSVSGSKKSFELSLSGKGLGDSAAIIAGRCLCSASTEDTNWSCSKLDLSSNQIGRIGFESLAKSLKSATNAIDVIDISNNYLTQEEKNEVMMAFVEALKVNTTIVDFRYDKKGVHPDIQKEIEEHLSINKFIHEPAGKHESSTFSAMLYGTKKPDNRLLLLEAAKQKIMRSNIPEQARRPLIGEVDSALQKEKIRAESPKKDVPSPKTPTKRTPFAILARAHGFFSKGSKPSEAVRSRSLSDEPVAPSANASQKPAVDAKRRKSLPTGLASILSGIGIKKHR
jgi:hypothetical protein